MRRTSYFAITAIVGIFCAFSVAFGQTDVADKYLISAKAGAVNHVEGAVSVIRTSGTSGSLLKRDRVEVGDRVTTGSNGRAEVLLNPGSYVRLSGNSSFEFGTTDLEDLQLKLDSGSAIFEVFAADEFRVSITTPKGKVALIDTGIYRVDVASDGTALLSVTKGKAEVGESSATVVKEGRTGTVGTSTVAVAKFDKGKRDNFAQWSKDRSNELAKVSSSIKDRNLNNALLRGFGAGRWNLYNSFGLWIFDASYGGFCFMPFGSGWRSPYGGWYNNGIYWPYTRYPYNGYPIVPVAPGTRKGSEVIRVPPQGSGSGSVKHPKEGNDTPPFTKISRDGDSGGGRGGMINRKSDFDIFDTGRSGSSSPTFNAPVYSPPAAAPAPMKDAGVRIKP